MSLVGSLTPYSVTMYLERFIQAQEQTYAGALAELKAGKKTGHWIWWISRSLGG